MTKKRASRMKKSVKNNKEEDVENKGEMRTPKIKKKNMSKMKKKTMLEEYE